MPYPEFGTNNHFACPECRYPIAVYSENLSGVYKCGNCDRFITVCIYISNTANDPQPIDPRNIC
jgi:ribosomal protein L37AE/L43A